MPEAHRRTGTFPRAATTFTFVAGHSPSGGERSLAILGVPLRGSGRDVWKE
ncbi:hypothetical protein [Schlesneria sp.]|uniref:hypothetical protein n=1 Tax=Schlesneria sp. TaxID=2762018 RepID=UPI002EDF53B9